MDVFDLRRSLVDSYANYIRSFIRIKDGRIDAKVKEELDSGLLWPEPLIHQWPGHAIYVKTKVRLAADLYNRWTTPYTRWDRNQPPRT